MNILPGVVEILDALQERRIPTGLATGNVRDGGRLKLEVANLWHYFPFGGFGSDAEDRGELTRIGLQKGREFAGIGTPNQESFIIGDSPLDISAARDAGAQCIAVMTGWTPREEMVAENPAWLLEDLSDTAQLLRIMGLE